MKPIVRCQSQLLFRRSYRPNRRHSNPANREAEHRFPPGETVWRETAINDRPVAQEQSARLITGRPRSMTVRDDQPSLSTALRATARQALQIRTKVRRAVARSAKATE